MDVRLRADFLAMSFPFRIFPGYSIPMSGVRPNTFKVVQLNTENLFLFLDDQTTRDWKNLSEKEWQKLSNASVNNKSLVKTLWLAESLLHIDADLICLNEVGGSESLNNFAKIFLRDRYIPHLIEGNSDRGIDVGYLVRRGLPIRAEIHTHKDRPLNFIYPHEELSNQYHSKAPEKQVKTHYFSRDCAELRLYAEDSEQPSLIVLLVHLKSKLDPDGIDPQGTSRRRAELKTLLEVYRETRARTTPPTPVIVTGDFNGCARRDHLSEEFSELLNTDLTCALETLGISGNDSCTQLQFNRGGAIGYLQIDFILVSPELKDQLVPEGTYVYRYLSDLKVPLPLPLTLDQRLHLPSDHYPVVATFRDLFNR